MTKFSDRVGITQPATELQVNSMNDGLRNSLWNLLVNEVANWSTFLYNLSYHYLKWPTDRLPTYSPYETKQSRERRELLRDKFFQDEWYDVYNLLQHVIEYYDNYKASMEFDYPDFCKELNQILERELSGYRVIGIEIVPITNELEIGTIRDAMSDSSGLGFRGVNQHITKLLILSVY